VDNVGTVPAAVTAYLAAQEFKPDLIISAGTAGGFRSKGAGIGDVFLAKGFANHDRRIPIPVRLEANSLFHLGILCGAALFENPNEQIQTQSSVWGPRGGFAPRGLPSETGFCQKVVPIMTGESQPRCAWKPTAIPSRYIVWGGLI
jgi:hypothetical protein